MPCFRPEACHCTDYTEQAACAFFDEPESGSVPPTLGPGPKPAEETPRVEAFPAADFHIAQRALHEIRLGLGFTRELVTTLPLNPEIRLDTNAMRKAMRVIVTRLEAAERACLQLGLPF